MYFGMNLFKGHSFKHSKPNQVDLQNFKVLKSTKRADNCNNLLEEALHRQFFWHWDGSFQINISHGRLASITVIPHHLSTHDQGVNDKPASVQKRGVVNTHCTRIAVK